jgi:hypothetical protein
MYKLWRVTLLKRGAHVLVNTNYSSRDGIPARWESGTVVGIAQRGRLCRIRIDDSGGPWSGQTNVFPAARVKRAITR